MDQWLEEIPLLLFAPQTSSLQPNHRPCLTCAQNVGPLRPAATRPKTPLAPVWRGAAPRGAHPDSPRSFGCCGVGLGHDCGSGPAWGGPLESRGWVWAEPTLQRGDLSPATAGKPRDDNCVAIAAVFISGSIKPNPGVGTLHRDGARWSRQPEPRAGWARGAAGSPPAPAHPGWGRSLRRVVPTPSPCDPLGQGRCKQGPGQGHPALPPPLPRP